MSKYKILSLDGGGIKGIITAILLQKLTKAAGLSNFLNEVNLIAGTSTGGLLALSLANGLTPSAMIDIYEKEGKFIFYDTILDNILDLGRMIGAGYKNENLKRILKRTFGETTLDQLKKHVLITAFDLDNQADNLNKRTWKPKIFHNMEGEGNDGKELVYKVALYTSAAPTYFPTYEGYVDGGVYANNPSMCALAQSQDLRYFESPKLSDVVLLSLGTGTSLSFIEGQTHDWGNLQWVKPLIDLMLDGVSGIADYECKQILKENYFRLAPVFPHDILVEMDDADKIPYMIDFAAKVDLSDAISWLNQHWN